MRPFLALAALFCITVFSSPLFSDVIFDEGASGDLSGNLASPTPLDVMIGDNTVIGQVGENGNTGATDGSDADYFTVVIEMGELLTSINVDSRSGAGQSFFAYTTAAAFNGQTGSDIDGQVLFNNSSGEVLDNLTGGLTPLGPGTYSFWVQETASTTVDYSFTLTVASAVPEPTSMMFGVLGCCGLVLRRKRS